MNILKVSAELKSLGTVINNFRDKSKVNSKTKKELKNLGIQCHQLSDKIIRDHADEGIAKDCFLEILNRFNQILLDEQ